MAGRAVDGIQDLIDRTTGSKIEAKVTVNQPYAQDQHETLFYRHPRGGRAKYLEGPLVEHFREWIGNFSDLFLQDGQTAESAWAITVGRELQDSVADNAPLEFGDLRQSAGLTVKVGSKTTVRVPPRQPRLTEQELDAKDYLRHMGEGYRE